MENLKNVAPLEDFNWEAYENGESLSNVSHEDMEKAYDNTLNKVNDREVVDGTVIAGNIKFGSILFRGLADIFPVGRLRINQTVNSNPFSKNKALIESTAVKALIP